MTTAISRSGLLWFAAVAVIAAAALASQPCCAATLTGMVRGLGGSPIPGATVTIGEQSDITGASGEYTIGPLAPASYTIIAAKTGYYSEKRVMALVSGPNALDFTLAPYPANNLLLDPSFEAQTVFNNQYIQEPGPYSLVCWSPWMGQTFTTGTYGLGAETRFGNQGGNYFHGGTQAFSAIGIAGGASAPPFHHRVWQEAAVQPGGDYAASVWVYTNNWNATNPGFGSHADDFAGIIVEEMDQSGAVTITRPKVGVTTGAAQWRYVSLPFTAGPTTVKVRVILDSVNNHFHTVSRIIFDDVALDGPTASSGTLSGTVRDLGGAPIAGATVTAGDAFGTTDASGMYTIASVVPGRYTITAAKSGYYDEKSLAIVVTGANTLDFAMAPYPANNLLLTPGFEIVPDQWNQPTGPWTAPAWGAWSRQSVSGNQHGFGNDTRLRGGQHFHSGVDSFCIVGMSGTPPWRAKGSQEVFVVPGGNYTASVWIYTYDLTLTGTGFGTSTNDFAGIIVEELGQNGTVIVTHPKVGVTTGAARWRYVSLPFTANPATLKARVILDSSTNHRYMISRVKFDDAALDGPAAYANISGTVRDLGGSPIEGATVTCGNASGITDSSGQYSLQATATTVPTPVTAAKPGYYSEYFRQAWLPGAYEANFTLVSLPENNLLLDTGFEFNPTVWHQWAGPYALDYGAWSTRAITQNYQGQGNESRSVNQGGNNYHSGSNAYTTNGLAPLLGGPGAPYHNQVRQSAAVQPGGNYTASVFVYTNNWHATNPGFGSHANDFAGIVVEEINRDGEVTAQHRAGVTTGAARWRHVRIPFTAGSTTVAVRFVLDSYHHQSYLEGRISYDDAALDGPIPGSGTLSGTVRNMDGLPVAGATVTVGELSATAGANGVYTISDVTPGKYAVRAEKPGYYYESKTLLVVTGANTLDFALAQSPRNNLLLDPGFEGVTGWHQASGPWSRAFGPWTGEFWERRQEMGAESAWPLPRFIHNGSQAFTVAGAEYWPPYYSEVSQTVDITSDGVYKASVWIYTHSAMADGFGSSPDDFAGLMIYELDEYDSVMVVHPEIGVTTGASHWRYVSYSFTPSEISKRIRFVLCTNHNYERNSVRIIYDDAALDAPLPPVEVSSISEARALGDGTPVRLTGKVVTAAFDGFFYIQEEDRSSGIKVISDVSVVAGDLVTAVGVLETDDGERTISASEVTKTGTGTRPGAIGLSNRAASQQLPIGLYVTVWGTVESSGNVFTITDGSGTSIKVYGPAGYSAAAGSYVSVVGALGTESLGGVPVCHAVSVVPHD